MNDEPVEIVAQIDWGDEPPVQDAKAELVPPEEKKAPPPPPKEKPRAKARAIEDVGVNTSRTIERAGIQVFRPDDCFISEMEIQGRRHLIWAESDQEDDKIDVVQVIKLIAKERGLTGVLHIQYNEHDGFNVKSSHPASYEPPSDDQMRKFFTS